MEKLSKILFKVLMMGCMLGWFNHAYGQHPADVSSQISKLMPKPMQKTPNAAAMEKYGDYQVNLYTGLPDISIPIFEVSSGPLHLPISLNYHASGIKYTDQASWAGLGWSVIAGGQISRNIIGKRDEEQFLTYINDYTASSPNCNLTYYKEQTVIGNDREPDLFSYSFPGKSGKFYLRQGGQPPYLFPEAAIRITPGNGIGFFDITDENGIRYRFGQNSANVSGRESTTTQSGSTVTSGTTTWYLMEVHSPDTDDQISITYQEVGSLQLSDIGHNISVADQCATEYEPDLPCPGLNLMVTEVYSYSSSTQFGIDEILYKTGKVKFVLGPNRSDIPNLKSLDRIEVYRKSGGQYILTKSFKMVNNDYFKNSDNNQNLRLKLNEVQVRDGAQSLINKYAFAYHTNNFSWDQALHSKRRDYFGFYNGKPNTNLIPQQNIDYYATNVPEPSTISIGGANRSTDTVYLKEAMLKRITYPTKGYTEFQYEPHRYSEGGVTTFVGGLRIKRITSVTGTATLSKEYRYGENESGLGTKNFYHNGFYFMAEQQVRTKGGTNYTHVQREYRSRMFFSNSVIGPGFEDSPIVYPKVTEYEAGTAVNGKTLYEFDNNTHIADPLFSVPYSNKTFRNSMSWARGKLTKKSVYNSAGTLVAQTDISYTLFKNQSALIGQAAVQYIIGGTSFWSGPWMLYCNDATYGPYDGYTFHVWNFSKTTGVYKETNRTETLYSPGLSGYAKTTITGYHDAYLQPIHKEERVSTNPQAVVTKTRYPFDIINVSSNYVGTAYILKQMVLRNMLDRPVEQYTLTQDTNGSNQKIIAGQVSTFKETTMSRYHPDSVFMLETAGTVAPAGYTAANASTGAAWLMKDSRYRFRLRFDAYDGSGNIAQVTKSNDQPTSYLWAYDGAYPVAMATNAQASQIAFTSFETIEKGGWTYTGTEELLPPGNAKTGRYAYLLSTGALSRTVTGAGTSNRFKVSFWAKTVSGTQSWTFMGAAESLTTSWKLVEREVTAASLSISGSGIYVDELRISPINAQLTTFTYHPLLGIASQLDPKNHGNYYLYDHFGRLETVKNEDGYILEHYEYTYIK
jgi:hypothetical protein